MASECKRPTIVVEDLKADLKTVLRCSCPTTPGIITEPTYDLCKCGKPKCKGKGSSCGAIVPTPVAFPHVSANPGIIRSLEGLAPGSCVFIRVKATSLGFYIGSYAGFNCGSVLLANSFNQLTLLGAIVVGTSGGAVPPPLTIGSFQAVQAAIDVSDITSIELLNGDLCTFLGTAAATGAFPAPPAAPAALAATPSGITNAGVLSLVALATGTMPPGMVQS